MGVRACACVCVCVDRMVTFDYVMGHQIVGQKGVSIGMKQFLNPPLTWPHHLQRPSPPWITSGTGTLFWENKHALWGEIPHKGFALVLDRHAHVLDIYSFVLTSDIFVPSPEPESSRGRRPGGVACALAERLPWQRVLEPNKLQKSFQICFRCVCGWGVIGDTGNALLSSSSAVDAGNPTFLFEYLRRPIPLRPAGKP